MKAMIAIFYSRAGVPKSEEEMLKIARHKTDSARKDFEFIFASRNEREGIKLSVGLKYSF